MLTIRLRGEYEGHNKVNEVFNITSEVGLKLSIEDDDGEILSVMCSSQPLTTAMRVYIDGTMDIELNGHKDGIKVTDGTMTIRRV